MHKYRFTIHGDNAEKLQVPYHDIWPVLLECTFYVRGGETEAELDKITDGILHAFDNPQRLGAPMSKGTLERIE